MAGERSHLRYHYGGELLKLIYFYIYVCSNIDRININTRAS